MLDRTIKALPVTLSLAALVVSGLTLNRASNAEATYADTVDVGQFEDLDARVGELDVHVSTLESNAPPLTERWRVDAMESSVESAAEDILQLQADLSSLRLELSSFERRIRSLER